MKTIRKNVFETNSSSTHAICIPKELKNIKFPEKIYFHIGEFGWGPEVIEGEELADYLYTAIYALYSECDDKWNVVGLQEKGQECLTFIETVLREHGCIAAFSDSYNDEGYIYVGYIDHGGECEKFVNSVCSNKELLINYLQGGILYMGNDNSYCGEDIELMLDCNESSHPLRDTHIIFMKMN